LTCLAEGLTEKPEGCSLELAIERRFRDGNLFLGKPFNTEELMSMVKSLLLVK